MSRGQLLGYILIMAVNLECPSLTRLYLKGEVMNKKLLAFATSMMLVFGGSLLVKAQSGTTDNWQNVPNQGRCQSSIRPPSYFCSIPTDDGSLLSIYVTLQPDGSFTNGQISKGAEYCYNGQCAPSFSTNNWSGSNLSGTFR